MVRILLFVQLSDVSFGVTGLRALETEESIAREGKESATNRIASKAQNAIHHATLSIEMGQAVFPASGGVL